MKKELERYLKLFVGVFICALGTIVIIRSNIGYSPWDVFHQGFSKVIGITIGQASIAAGIVVVALDILLGQKIGIGTVFNMIFYGLYMDLILYLNIIPLGKGLVYGVLMLYTGLIIFSYGCYLYIGAGLGCGPRDGLMVGLTQKTNLSVKAVRNMIEIFVLAIGYLLGGYAGMGTVITALTTGYIIQKTFKVLKFDVSTVKHRSLNEELKFYKRIFS